MSEHLQPQFRTKAPGIESRIIRKKWKFEKSRGDFSNYSLKLLQNVLAWAIVDELIADLADNILDHAHIDSARRSRHVFPRRFLSLSLKSPRKTSSLTKPNPKPKLPRKNGTGKFLRRENQERRWAESWNRRKTVKGLGFGDCSVYEWETQRERETESGPEKGIKSGI